MSSSAQSFRIRLPATSLSSSTTLPVLVAAAAAGKPLEVTAIRITNESSTTSGNAAIELINSTTNGPGTPATGNALVSKMSPSSGAAGLTPYGSGFTGAPTGTQNILYREGFNILNGHFYIPVPEERFEIPGGNYLWVRLPILPASTTMTIEVSVIERG